MFQWVGRAFRWAFRSDKPEEIRAEGSHFDIVRPTNDANDNHFANATLASIDQHANSEVRANIRKVVRYEYANSNILKGVVLTRANTMIGKGPKLILIPEPERLNRSDSEEDLKYTTDVCRSIEKKISRFFREQRLPEKLRQMVKAKIVDGETFMALMRLSDSEWGFTIRVVDCDRVSSQVGLNPQAADQVDYVDGILYDEATGEPVSYQIYKKHPNGEYITSGIFEGNQTPSDYHTLGADSVFHWFRRDYGEQYRGISELVGATDIAAILRRARKAIALGIEHSASLSMVLASDLDPEEEEDIELPNVWEGMPMRSNTAMMLPNGVTPTQIKTDHPTSPYNDFRDACFSDIGRSMDMPYNRASGSSASYNFSSAMIDGLHDLLTCEIDRDTVRDECLDKLFRFIIAEAVLNPEHLVFSEEEKRYLLGAPESEMLPDRVWHFETEGNEIEPLKQTNAAVAAIQAGINTRTAYYSKKGVDIDAQDAIAARENGVTIEEYRAQIFSNIGSGQQLEEEPGEQQNGSSTASSTGGEPAT